MIKITMYTFCMIPNFEIGGFGFIKALHISNTRFTSKP